MFSKFKKVLVSLALASSLALAPINVSAEYNGPINGSDSADLAVNRAGQPVQVPVYLTGSAASVSEYVIDVSPSIIINLDSNSTLASNLDESSPQNVSGAIYLKLTEAVNFEEKNLQVTPRFVALDGETMVNLAADEGASTYVKISDLSIDSNLLRFGTYSDSVLVKDSNATVFAQNDKDGVKSVPTHVDAAKSAAIRQAMPNAIDDNGNVRISDDQQIGNVTFTCAFVEAN